VITNEQLGQAAERIPDLVELRNQNRISIDLIEALVALDKEGGGSSDPLAVDEIFASKKNEEPEATWAEDPVAELAPKAEKRVEEVKQPEVAPVAVVPKVEPTVEKQEPPKVKEVVEEVKQSEVAPVDDFDALWA
jgi:glutamate synthase domain-containing protein 1